MLTFLRRTEVEWRTTKSWRSTPCRARSPASGRDVGRDNGCDNGRDNGRVQREGERGEREARERRERGEREARERRERGERLDSPLALHDDGRDDGHDDRRVQGYLAHSHPVGHYSRTMPLAL